MVNKKKKDEDEEFDDELNEEIEINDEDDDFDADSDDDGDDGDLDDDSDPDDEDESDESKKSNKNNVVLSKHKEEGKHALKYDSIFKGSKKEPLGEDDFDSFSGYYPDSIEVDKSSQYHFESIDNEQYVRQKQVKESVYGVLDEHTEINFLNNRRKPSKVDFNHYYSLLKTHLKEESFTNIELFNELSVYFSDNIFNMFKLLDNEWRNLILKELEDHIGKNKKSKDVINRNIYEGTEIEFIWEDEYGEDKIITGVVLETDYANSCYKIDSYENIYTVELERITQILNNTKFKYNLNKLNNIDFL
jgi:hypothetical protein